MRGVSSDYETQDKLDTPAQEQKTVMVTYKIRELPSVLLNFLGWFVNVVIEFITLRLLVFDFKKSKSGEHKLGQNVLNTLTNVIFSKISTSKLNIDSVAELIVEKLKDNESYR